MNRMASGERPAEWQQSAHHVAKAAEADDANLEAGLIQVVVLERRVDGDAGAQQRRRAVKRQVARDVQHEAA